MSEEIINIGKCMVGCTSAQEGGPCAGIVTCQNNQEDEPIIPPRCLYLDEFRAIKKFDGKLVYRMKTEKKHIENIEKYYLQIQDSKDINLKKEDDGTFQLDDNNSNNSNFEDYFDLSTNERGDVKGIIVIGKNPGKIDDSEIKEFRKLSDSDTYSESFYEGIVEFWKKNWFHGVHKIPYYNNINWILNYLFFKVPYLNLQEVLLTEIIKCQFASEMSTSMFEFKIGYFVHWLNEDGKDKFTRIILKEDDCINGQLTINCKNRVELCRINEVLKEWKYLMHKKDEITDDLINILYDKNNEKLNESKSAIKINFKDYFDEVLLSELDSLPTIIKDHIIANAFDWYNYNFNLTRGLDKNKFADFKKIHGVSEKYKNITELKKHLNSTYLPKLEKYFKELTLFRNQNDSNQAYKDTSEYYPSSNECHRKYLKEELAIDEIKNWPIICIGKDEFKMISFAYPDRIVIGLPHVTGAHGDAPKIYDFTKKNKFEDVRQSIVQWLIWRLEDTTKVTSRGQKYIVANAKYFDLDSKPLEEVS
jgi:hypothetical protein